VWIEGVYGGEAFWGWFGVWMYHNVLRLTAFGWQCWWFCLGFYSGVLVVASGWCLCMPCAGVRCVEKSQVMSFKFPQNLRVEIPILVIS
jgi:hypothetical protein